MSEFKMPTEIVELPSKGLLYDKTSELSNGTIEIKHMSAREEDILTNRRFIEDGTVLDRLLKSLIVTPINFDDLLMGISKQTVNINKLVLGDKAENKIIRYVPHGLNEKLYFPINQDHELYPQLQEFKKSLLQGKEYDFVLFFNALPRSFLS